MASLRKLDRRYSRAVRQLLADENGIAYCYTCGRTAHWKQLDLGHYIDRRWRATRFSEQNTKPQCHRCNRYEDGAPEQFRKNLVREYGEEAIAEMEANKRKTIDDEQIERIVEALEAQAADRDLPG